MSATDRYFTPERRENLSRVMKDSALSVLSREGEVRTLEVVATMKNIRDAGLITNPPHEVGFLRGFFDKAISAMAYQDGGRLRIPMPRRRSQRQRRRLALRRPVERARARAPISCRQTGTRRTASAALQHAGP